MMARAVVKVASVAQVVPIAVVAIVVLCFESMVFVEKALFRTRYDVWIYAVAGGIDGDVARQLVYYPHLSYQFFYGFQLLVWRQGGYEDELAILVVE
jgi:hypothetical protein